MARVDNDNDETGRNHETKINSDPVCFRTLRTREAIDARLARSMTVGSAILDAVEKQSQTLGRTLAPLSNSRGPKTQHMTLIVPGGPSLQAVRSSSRRSRSLLAVSACLVCVVLIGSCALAIILFLGKTPELTGTAAVSAVVERIMGVESRGEVNATSKTSSAVGPGQFIEGTWLHMMRVHRPDLANARTKAETLDLRREPKLAREITTRYVERNAALLKKRGFPVTASTVYLAHFAGGAGAIAILSSEEDADAALVMAEADATGRIKREQIIKANPFLQNFSVGDLKRWADRKMRGPRLDLIKLSERSVKK